MRKNPSAWLDAASTHVSSLKGTVTEKIDSWVSGKTALTTMFAGSVVSANVLAAKIATFDIPLYGVANVPAGFLGLAAAFLFSDALSELYGAETAHKVVNGTVLAVGLSIGLIHASVAMPSAPFYDLGQEYAAVLSSGTSISVASILSLLVSQNLDVSIFDRLRNRGLPKWVRNVGSTITSQFVDTVLFITLAFSVLPTLLGTNVTPLYVLPSLIISQYVVKVLVALGDTPLFYAITAGSE